MEKKEKFKNRKVRLDDVLEIISFIGYTGFLIILGVWALPFMPLHVQKGFAPCILGAACYPLFHQFREWGLFDD